MNELARHSRAASDTRMGSLLFIMGVFLIAAAPLPHKTLTVRVVHVAAHQYRRARGAMRVVGAVRPEKRVPHLDTVVHLEIEVEWPPSCIGQMALILHQTQIMLNPTTTWSDSGVH